MVFLNVGVPVTESNSVTAEAGFYCFNKDDDLTALMPFLSGYRYTLNGSGAGLYIEPTTGYTIGGTDRTKMDAVNSPIMIDGKFAEQNVQNAVAYFATVVKYE